MKLQLIKPHNAKQKLEANGGVHSLVGDLFSQIELNKRAE